MLANAAVIDILAISWLVVVWLTYDLVIEPMLTRRVGLNHYMIETRKAWMLRMLDREHRITDTSLVGSVMHSVSFFASTTMLILVGLVGLLGAADQAHEALAELSFTVTTGKTLFEIKILTLVAIFIYAFMKFTWALRQFNYSCALIGAAPLAPVPSPERETTAAQIAELLSLAVGSFNGGLRAYYLSLSVLTWFVHPWLFIAVTTWMLMVMLRRQLLSRTFRAIRGRADANPLRR